MTKQFKNILSVLMLCSLLFLITGCGPSKTVTRTDFALDTVVTITVYNEDDESVLEEPFNLIRRLNEKLDAFSESSEVSAINQKAGIEGVKVSEDTFKLIKQGLIYGEKTDGKFDITIGPLVDLWNIKEPEKGIVPNKESIETARAKVDYRKVLLNDTEQTIFLKEPGMKINLGAIAKGYIGDRVKTQMEEAGIEHAVINLGGNVVLIGGKDKRTAFNVGVENPENTSGDPIGMLTISDKSIVTSGDYQRYFVGENGKRYHHIIDPKTGYPAESGLHQVTIVTDSSTDADALSTSLFLMGMDKSKDYLHGIKGVEAIFVTTDNQVFVTKGLDKTFIFDDAKMGEKYHQKNRIE